MLNVDDALRKLGDLTSPVLDTEVIPLTESKGRVVASAIDAPMDLPPFDASAMDGYALHVNDLNQDRALAVVGESRAGHVYQDPLAPGTAIRIFTGAPIPRGTSAVVIQEDVERNGDQISFRASLEIGENIRSRGHDIAKTQLLAKAGDRLDAYKISWLAACGVTNVTAVRRIRVALFSTGDELIDPGTPLGPGQIYDANRTALRELVSERPVEVLDLGALPDDPQAINRALETAAEAADVVVTSGGVSVGDADYVRDVVAQAGSLDFWKIALKPGKPLAVGRVGKALFFGLPGNPVSTIITYLLFVAPTIDRLCGMPDSTPYRLPAILQETIEHHQGRREYVRGVFGMNDDRVTVSPTGDQSSNRLATFANANCLIVVPEQTDDIKAGSIVDIVLLPTDRSHIWTG
ncbi:MAG: gephyrin-like molybdotransferase Glp [Pseudomonadota bacterium]|nr:gephyrin-like molybdotransferase Glp [Pseudomonadota bacterium]|tara:strand:- start:64 stop:1284 length:1221 start_codon:yes stop_codon:yes gene_type:complete